MIEKQIDANEFIRDAYTQYGRHINGSDYQVGRMFCDVYDGLKISYRHYLQALWESPNKMTKVQAVLGDAMKKYQFTGDAAGSEIVYSLANDYKCVETQGNSGSRTMTLTMGGSAPRYVECMLKPQIREQFDRLMPYVPEEITITGYPEKRYIPTAVPLALIAGAGTGMGIGCANVLPAFTAKSMLDAYLNNDPHRLRLNYGYSLGFGFDPNIWYDCTNNTPIKDDGKGNWVPCEGLENQEPSDENKEALEAAWRGDKFRLAIDIPIYYSEVNGKTGIVAVCDPKIIAPWRSKKIEEWIQDGYVEVFDLSDEIGKLFFTITDGTRKVKLEELKDEVWWNCGVYQGQSYNITIATGKITGRVGIGQWIDFTYKNYSALYQKYINAELDKLAWQEAIWTNFRFVADMLIKYDPSEKSDEDIAKECNADPAMKKIHKAHPELKCTVDIVHAIGQKAINTLRNAKPEDYLQKVYDRRDYFNNINISDEIVAFVDCWDNL